MKWLPGLAVSVCLAGAAGAAGPPAFAEGPARLVADLAPGRSDFDARPSGFQPVGSRSVFLRADDELWQALWVTDGTVAGTSLVGVLGDSAVAVGSTGSVAFYQSGDDPAIWRTDGTPAGTFPVASGLTRPPDGGILTALDGGRLFFTGCSPELGCELWSSNGTAAGTAPAGEIVPGPEGADIRELAATGGRAFLLAETPGSPLGLWVAGARGLTRLAETPDGRALAVQGGRAWFVARSAPGEGFEIWTSDGTAAGTRPVTSFAPLEPFSIYKTLTVLDGRAWFTADDGRQGVELWSVGLEPSSLRRATDLRAEYSSVWDIARAGGRVVFVAYQGSDGSELWTSRGDLRSTARLAGCPGGCPTPVGPLTPLDPRRLVFYGLSSKGAGFWVTDGTGAGTRLLRRVGRYEHSQAVAMNGRALIEVTDEYDTGHLWVTDGTAAGTFRAALGGPHWSHYYGWTGRLEAGTANGGLVFPGLLGDEGSGYQEVLWRTDGSPAGSRPLRKARRALGSNPDRLTPLRGGLLFWTCTDTAAELRAVELRFIQGTETTLLLSIEDDCPSYPAPLVVVGDVAFVFWLGSLWRTDGTPEGTNVLFQGSSESYPGSAIRYGDRAAFPVFLPYPTFHDELWVTDGTAAGTHRQLELPAETQIGGLTSLAGRLWFFDWVPNGNESGGALQLWVSDGTPAGTRTLAEGGDTWPGQPLFAEAGGRVYFLFGEIGEPLGIWSTDGTRAGTGPAVTTATGAVAPGSLTAIGDRLYFAARRRDDDDGPLLPWVSDGTDAGTELLADVELLDELGFGMWDEPPFVELDGHVYFAANELWSTDGTPDGTARLLDIAPALLGSQPQELTVWNGRLWFRARDAVHGMELWSSDGTAEGTRMVQDIAPGASWSSPKKMTGTEEGLYFSAHDRAHGRELWVLYPF